MITVILLLCLTITAAVPVSPHVPPSQRSHRGVTQAQRVPTETPDNQTPAPLSPIVEKPQLSVPQQPDPQSIPQLSPFLQQYSWSPQGGSPLFIPLQPSVYGSQPTNQLMLQQQPLIFPPFGYFPLFSSPYMNPQLLSQVPPYGYPMTIESPAAAASQYQLANSPVSPAENTAAAPAGGAAQLVQQQQQQQQPQQQPQQQQQPQNSQRIVYMLQQQMTSPLGSLSSEELQMAAKMSRLGVYMPTLLSNQPAVGGQPQAQANGLTNQQQQGVAPTVETPAVGVPQPQGLACSGSQADAVGGPAGLEKAAQEAVTVQTPAQVRVQPTQGNPA